MWHKNPEVKMINVALKFNKTLLLCLLLTFSYANLANAQISTTKLSSNQKLAYDISFNGNADFLFRCIDKGPENAFGKLVKAQVISYEDDQNGYYLLVNAKRKDWAGFNGYFRYEVTIRKLRHNRIECSYVKYLRDTSKF